MTCVLLVTVKNAIRKAGGASGLHGCAAVLSRMDPDGSRNLTQEELAEGLRQFGVYLSEDEAEKVMKYFDRDGSGKVRAVT